MFRTTAACIEWSVMQTFTARTVIASVAAAESDLSSTDSKAKLAGS